MLTTKNTYSDNDAHAREEEQNQKPNHAQAQQLPSQGLWPLDDEQITKLLDLVAIENHKILRLSLLESF